MKKIMFVCTGNICRSPMAHHYMQKRVLELGKEDEYLISSCGINAANGQSPSVNSVEVMKNYGVSLENHKSTFISDSLISEYDLIITLTKYHKNIVVSTYPELNGKVYTLKEYADPGADYIDIDDPWGLDKTVYEDCAKEIVENVDKLLEKF
ncbi:Low molecular weight protein-tyrosine-phosphatase YwlE [compost metagenome]